MCDNCRINVNKEIALSQEVANMSKTRGRRKRLQAVSMLAALLAISVFQSVSYAVTPDEAAAWSEDLRFIQAEAAAQHPALFHKLDEAAWDRQFDDLVARVGAMDHFEITVALARIMASVGDGHTRLTLPLTDGIDFMQGHSKTPAPLIEGLQFHQFPVRFFIDSQGLHVRRIDASRRAVLGGRVVKLGNLAVDEALAAVAPTVRRDNNMQLQHHLPIHLVLADVLAACDVIDDRRKLPIEVVMPDGPTEAALLDRVEPGEAVEWADAFAGDDVPLYLQRNDQNFWFTHLPDDDVVYLQFNVVYNREDETIRELAARLGGFLSANRVEYLVIDLRNNRGGNNGLLLPLLHELICAGVNETGRLYTLIGRTTFSAAMTFALQLEKHTNTLFVGEPSGSSGNHYGDSRKIKLPNSGLTVRVSTRYWQNDFTDNRPWIDPHVPAEVAMADYRAGRDPVLDMVRSITGKRSQQSVAIDGNWQGTVTLGLNTFDTSIEFAGDGTGLMSLPQIGIETAVYNMRASNRGVAFEVDVDGNHGVLSGRIGGDWMIGELEARSMRFPFIVRKAD